jgi:hypothetical protein
MTMKISRKNKNELWAGCCEMWHKGRKQNNMTQDVLFMGCMVLSIKPRDDKTLKMARDSGT